LARVNRKACDDYVRQRGANAAARRELEGGDSPPLGGGTMCSPDARRTS
jgi:hypothetical protein